MTIYPFDVLPGTPSSLSEEILAFVREEFGTDAVPIFVPVRAPEASSELDCFSNKERHIEAAGGNQRYGWVLWRHGDAMIEAEFHELWMSPSRAARRRNSS